jgi:hypothetical protein
VFQPLQEEIMPVRIFGHPPMVHETGSAVNVVFQNGEKMVSLALDNSCGRMSTLNRGSIECHREKKDRDPEIDVVTAEVFGAGNGNINIPNTLDNFNKAMTWLNRIEYGLGAQSTSSFRVSER